MATVFLAYDGILEREVALKILREEYADDEEFVERFRSEAQSAASLNHPHIVAVYDWGRSEDGTTYYMTMEYVPGGTLKDRILTDGILPPQTAAEVASQIAEALEAAHKHDVVHRDIKPHNILLTASGDVKVADFGIARAASSTTTTQRDLLLGTAHYMSPEQAMGEPVGPQSDLYSLGVVFYEMLTGKLPYDVDTSADVGTVRGSEAIQPPKQVEPEISEKINAVVVRLLAQDPADRYGSARELVEELRRVRNVLLVASAEGERAADQGTLVVPPVLAKNPSGIRARSRPAVVYGKRRLSKRRTALAATFLFGLLALLGAAIWAPLSSSSEEQQVSRVQDLAGGPLAGLDEVFEGGSDWAPDLQTEVAGIKSSSKDDTWVQPTAADFNADPQNDDAPSSGAPAQSINAGSETEAQENALPRDAGEQDLRVSSAPNITVGNAPEQEVNVPDVAARSVEEASQVLSEAGFKMASTKTQSSPEPAGTVVGTDPPTGSKVKSGTVVNLIVSDGSEEVAPTSETSITSAQPSKKGKEATPISETSIPSTRSSKKGKGDQKSSSASCNSIRLRSGC
jgi:serine/threonine-protein kinase